MVTGWSEHYDIRVPSIIGWKKQSTAGVFMAKPASEKSDGRVKRSTIMTKGEWTLRASVSWHRPMKGGRDEDSVAERASEEYDEAKV